MESSESAAEGARRGLQDRRHATAARRRPRACQARQRAVSRCSCPTPHQACTRSSTPTRREAERHSVGDRAAQCRQLSDAAGAPVEGIVGLDRPDRRDRRRDQPARLRRGDHLHAANQNLALAETRPSQQGDRHGPPRHDRHADGLTDARAARAADRASPLQDRRCDARDRPPPADHQHRLPAAVIGTAPTARRRRNPADPHVPIDN